MDGAGLTAADPRPSSTPSLIPWIQIAVGWSLPLHADGDTPTTNRKAAADLSAGRQVLRTAPEHGSDDP
jgi:hypothetical protein